MPIISKASLFQIACYALEKERYLYGFNKMWSFFGLSIHLASILNDQWDPVIV